MLHQKLVYYNFAKSGAAYTKFKCLIKFFYVREVVEFNYYAVLPYLMNGLMTSV